MFLGISLKSLVPLKSFFASKVTRKIALSLVMCFQLGTLSLLWLSASSAWFVVSGAAAGVFVLHGGSWISVIEFGPLEEKFDDSKILYNTTVFLQENTISHALAPLARGRSYLFLYTFLHTIACAFWSVTSPVFIRLWNIDFRLDSAIALLCTRWKNRC